MRLTFVQLKFDEIYYLMNWLLMSWLFVQLVLISFHCWIFLVWSTWNQWMDASLPAYRETHNHVLDGASPCRERFRVCFLKLASWASQLADIPTAKARFAIHVLLTYVGYFASVSLQVLLVRPRDHPWVSFPNWIPHFLPKWETALEGGPVIG